jgi:hypothetical protein
MRSADVVRVLLGLADASLRVAWACDAFRSMKTGEVAALLDDVAMRGEQGEGRAKEALVAIVDALASPSLVDVTQKLREEAAGVPLLALDRLIRQPTRAVTTSSMAPPRQTKVPDYGFGRQLTLGERKSLARKHDRQLLARLLTDPHPDVIRGLLKNPRLTEEDLVRLIARRPSRSEILVEIARSPRWVHRSRVRVALLLNPATPHDLAVPLASLLLRHELRLVAESTQLSPVLRAACHEHLVRRPPRKDEGGTLQ